MSVRIVWRGLNLLQKVLLEKREWAQLENKLLMIGKVPKGNSFSREW